MDVNSFNSGTGTPCGSCTLSHETFSDETFQAQGRLTQVDRDFPITVLSEDSGALFHLSRFLDPESLARFKGSNQVLAHAGAIKNLEKVRTAKKVHLLQQDVIGGVIENVHIFKMIKSNLHQDIDELYDELTTHKICIKSDISGKEITQLFFNAVKEGCIKLLHFLLNSKLVRPDIIDAPSESMILYAYRNAKYKDSTLALLMKYGAVNPSPYTMTPLIQAVQRGLRDDVQVLIKLGAHVNARDVGFETALMHAINLRQNNPQKFDAIIQDLILECRDKILQYEASHPELADLIRQDLVTALNYAIPQLFSNLPGVEELVLALIFAGAPVNAEHLKSVFLPPYTRSITTITPKMMESQRKFVELFLDRGVRLTENDYNTLFNNLNGDCVFLFILPIPKKEQELFVENGKKLLVNKKEKIIQK